MVAGNKTIGLEIIPGTGFFQQTIDRLTLANVGNENRARSAARQIELVAIIDQSAVDGPQEPIPGFSFATRLVRFPIIFFPGTIPRPEKGNEAFDPMARHHLLSVGFNAPGVTAILGQLIEIGHMPAGQASGR